MNVSAALPTLHGWLWGKLSQRTEMKLDPYGKVAAVTSLK